ncbi:MAG TPA: EAL domain-containing protein [Steroidobacteraceae bacterium]|jgi:EAL domain-containing protein (putative c-di-GMP-specific phosphodiesterase class I)/GGDEF domain-containing protein
MSALIELLPDLVFLMRRDGSVASHVGGQGVPDLRLGGARGEAAWSESTAALIKQLVRRSISHRGPVESRFQEQGRDYDIRVTPQGPDRAICIVRATLPGSRDDVAEATGERPRPELDRRGFLRRLRESMSIAALREQPLAVAMLYVKDIQDIGQIMGSRISEQIMSAAILRLSAQAGAADAQPKWYLGQLGENVLAMVMNTADRDAIDACVSRVCASLREPVAVDDAEFRLTPYAGVGILGQDSSSPKALLDHARAAATEARRAASNRTFFYSDTLQLRSLARLDLARELREAIANRDIRFRYVGRHDLATGRLVAWVGYLRWQHPLRGEIPPAEFLRVAASTGLAVALSRAALKSLCEDFAALKRRSEPDVRISFGALRDHVFHEDFLNDVQRVLVEKAIPAERLELRISEKAFVTLDRGDFRSLQKRAVQLVVDEVGRGMSSLSLLARSPIWGLQLDRAWVTASSTDDVARRVCCAGIGMATALGITPIAAGVDDKAQRDALLKMGCRYGSGDLYAPHSPDITAADGQA